MSTFIFLAFSGSLLALMVGLCLTAKTIPNADLLMAAMCDYLDAGCSGKGHAP
jgi:hypothetical protein